MNFKKDKEILPKEITVTKNDGTVLTDTKEIREFISQLTVSKDIPIHVKDKPDFKVGDFEVRYGRSFSEHTFVFEVKCNAAMRFEAGTDETSDNYIRLKNLFEHQDEIKQLEEDIEKLEEQLISIKEQKDEVIDPDEIPVKETPAELESTYGDEDDYTPDDDNSIGSR